VSSEPTIRSRNTGGNHLVIAFLIGAAIAVGGGVIGLSVTVLGPVNAIIVFAGIAAGLAMITSLPLAMIALVLSAILLPFATLPVRIAFTPSLLDVAIGVFVLVYLFQWMTGRRTQLRTTPSHVLLLVYLTWLILSLVLGLRWAPLGATVIRQFAETVIAILLVFVVVDILRDMISLQRLTALIIMGVGLQATIAITLFALPDVTAESLLVRLSRVGYPDGGVIRYVEDNPDLGERAIGTWVDPNALGGILAIGAMLMAPQIVAKHPAIRPRWVITVSFGLTLIALVMTASRSSLLALLLGLVLLAILRHRYLLPWITLGVLIFLFLPQTAGYIDRFLQGFQAQDLATQMRIGEWRDALRLIGDYPLVGVGFTGTPRIGLYTDVANMYLLMANQIGLPGVLLFLTTIGSGLVYGWRTRFAARGMVGLDAIHLGAHLAIVVALVNAIADLYYFRLDFQSSITLFWLFFGIALASSAIAIKHRQEAISRQTAVEPDHEIM
jgi:polysaccharide biosynthesis protein PslJ